MKIIAHYRTGRKLFIPSLSKSEKSSLKLRLYSKHHGVNDSLSIPRTKHISFKIKLLHNLGKALHISRMLLENRRTQQQRGIE